MASLYAHRDSNIRKTWVLFTGFLIVVIGLGWLFSYVFNNPDILVIAVVFSSATAFVSYWYSDKIVLRISHARPVEMENAPEIYRIVENLAITAGLPMPKVYLIDEQAPNAFATGRNPEHAVVAVTTGLLEKLDRSELEGVIAHELSHIGNRDMLISTMAVILVGFVSLAADFFLRSMLWRGGFGGQRQRSAVNPVFLLIGIALIILAPIVATLMRLAISRKREFLADASGALLTRYPEGLANALIKISSDPVPLRMAHNATAHLWINNPFSAEGGSALGGKGRQKTSWLHHLFMTHPPVEERVKALRGLEI
ncbi:MAG: zinc metalloprotease HtpX [Candidatus Harrisonbacteria bacterium RIFCSPHIGHO2_01_FULL_44_13]|uniref:Protease HtpX homolog n=1 Tax=Candidatus Harrisonbacteria bacterium RIFCSPLOWO2_01_FULL_44_18 TaxID=1798407 RepID=A0A1G1ZMY5_9BACT|nr:MAG: zinc metalloprotease HtpX [Candidatus Harrisonbacteria bacterium RIFCSPHIGHO2_01_FULL_44_13]OGY65934.1 MAG: zinc metalloprotease HtpX [Candidatus Harrisonbacteria bacterium RIFCSPLOWO2_01_FULL_44_18]